MGRLDGSKRTEVFSPSVRLISMTEHPVETLFSVWYGSRNKPIDPLILSSIWKGYDYEEGSVLQMDRREKIKRILEAYPELSGDPADPRNVIKKTIEFLISSDLPPLEFVSFVFEVDKAMVAWRDQLVRARRATYWTTTSRTMDPSTIDVNIPQSVVDIGGDEGIDIYKSCVNTIRRSIKDLMDLGVPGEDIRLSPPSMIQRDYWSINLRELLKVLQKRVDWIAQATLWMPVISGIYESLEFECPDLASIIREATGKPNVKVENGKVVDHHYDNENYDRYTSKDPQPCDPLWLAYHGYSHPEDHTHDLKRCEQYQYLKNLYLPVWSQEYLDVLGWDRNSPSKVGPYDLVYQA